MNGEDGNGKPTGGAPIPPDSAAPAKNAWMQKILSRLEDFLAMGRIEPQIDIGASDTSTRLARERTDYAMNRTYWAADRTLQAWVRTALSMISFGFTLGKLGEAVHDIEVKGLLSHVRTMSVSGIAYGLVVLGTLALLMATLQHWLRVRELHRQGLPRQISISFIVAIILSVVGGFAFTALVMKV